MAAPKEIKSLIDRFNRNIEEYRSPDYKEAHIRQEFINPMFRALGWDLDNAQGAAPQFREVVHEDAIRLGGNKVAPDYAFRLRGERKFFVEAKKPAVALKDSAESAYQLRSYGWSSKLPMSILTDFEEFAVYDCRARPFQKDKATTGRTLYMTYAEYLDRWDEIASVFSKEAVLNGSFDKYAEVIKLRKGTAPVDEEFLREIEQWRDVLARVIALRNESLTQRELNFAVQATIDRIIFLRMCEDRGIEPYERLREAAGATNVYKRLLEVFRHADERYNSGLFHFEAEAGRHEPDRLTPKLKIDDVALKGIINSLYPPESPYRFAVLPPDILGQVYERFLGKVIRLTAGHRATVEEKIEVKRAGGVFYTPAFIVDYIVRKTVGPLLEGKTASKVSKLRVLDPACGSGSFLLSAYQFLLEWHLDWYVANDPEKQRKAVSKDERGDWRLTSMERKRILLNNIFGTDIDSQAVEVTKLSLVLKVLEGESSRSLDIQNRLFHERALPDLDRNIKCGNSLISPDLYLGSQQRIFEEEELYKVNAFDWKRGFPEVFGDGFDAVIGNPPYVRIQTMNEWTPESVEYFGQHYRAAKEGNYDLYAVFVERGLSLLNPRGSLGFIMPQKFCQVQFGQALRGLLAEGRHVSGFVSFTNNQVFDTAFVNTCIMILSKAGTPEFEYLEIPALGTPKSLPKALAEGITSHLPSRLLTNSPWVLRPADAMSLLEKLSSKGTPLEKCTSRIFQGLKTSADKIYVLEVLEAKGKTYRLHSAQLGREVELERELCHPLIKGTEMRPYAPLPSERVILFPYAADAGGAPTLIDAERLRHEFPKTWKYLKENESYLRLREDGKLAHAGWYAFGRSQALDVMPLPKIVTPDLAPCSSFLIDMTGELFLLGGAAGGYGILSNDGVDPLYLVGILNSSAANFFITSSGQQMESGYYSFEARFIRATPIPALDKRSTSRRGQVVEQVNSILALLERRASAKLQHERETLSRQIAATQSRIDSLVLELFGVSGQDAALIERYAPKSSR